MIKKIRRLLDFLPVIWKDQDDGGTGLYLYIRKKLKRLRKTQGLIFHDDFKYAICFCDHLIENTHFKAMQQKIRDRWGSTVYIDLSKEEREEHDADLDNWYTEAKLLTDEDRGALFFILNQRLMDWTA